MKKNYYQPIVAAAEVQTTSLMLGTSPNGIPVGDPVPGEGGA